jgi:hypothetical protein
MYSMEIRIPNGPSSEQVFRGEAPEQVIEVLIKAQTNATKKIRQQAKQITTLRELLADALASIVTEKLSSSTGDKRSESKEVEI